MNSEKLLAEVRETNLAYLMLARHMINEDRAEATYRLGISEELADLIGSLSVAQLVKIAASNMLMCRFRFDDRMVWDLITDHSKEQQNLGSVHAAILMGNKALAEV